MLLGGFAIVRPVRRPEGTVKALSIRQPWAWLIVHGFKDVENRSWSTQFRGLLLVHAGRTLDPRAAYAVELARSRGIAVPEVDDLPRGAIVGCVQVVDCVTAHTSPWFEGPYAFVLGNARPLDPTPMRGMLGLFEAPYMLEPQPYDLAP